MKLQIIFFMLNLCAAHYALPMKHTELLEKHKECTKQIEAAFALAQTVEQLHSLANHYQQKIDTCWFESLTNEKAPITQAWSALTIINWNCARQRREEIQHQSKTKNIIINNIILKD